MIHEFLRYDGNKNDAERNNESDFQQGCTQTTAHYIPIDIKGKIRQFITLFMNVYVIIVEEDGKMEGG